MKRSCRLVFGVLQTSQLPSFLFLLKRFGPYGVAANVSQELQNKLDAMSSKQPGHTMSSKPFWCDVTQRAIKCREESITCEVSITFITITDGTGSYDQKMTELDIL
jgi:hypothetical protein